MTRSNDVPIPAGVQPDVTKHGFDVDDWPKVWESVIRADILVVGTPLWLGEESSVCRVLIERLYGMSGLLNELGQSIYYNKVGGCVVTGNEDRIKHAAMTIAFALNHLGLTIPPQADCGCLHRAVFPACTQRGLDVQMLVFARDRFATEAILPGR